MLETAIIFFREGLEAFLIVAIMLGYLMHMGQRSHIRYVIAGIVASVIVSVILAWVLQQFDISGPLVEGIMAIIGSILVISMTIHMQKAGRHIKKMITDKVGAAVQKTIYGGTTLFIFTTLMITREGIELVLFCYSIALQSTFQEMMLGALLGFLGVVIVALLWVKYSGKIRLDILFRITFFLLLVFGIHLFFYGLHELAEGGYLPFFS